MNDDFKGLRERLADLADAPAPASPFDAARTAASGRRRVLAYRTSALGGGGALAVAAVVGIVAALAPRAQPASPRASAGTDPLVKAVDYGWLPASLPNVSYAATADGRADDVIAQGDIKPEGEPRVDLRVLPGDGPGTTSAYQQVIPTRLDDGPQAYWVTQPPGSGEMLGDFQLRFPTKSGRWVVMDWRADGNRAEYYLIAGAPQTALAANPGHGTPPTAVPASPQWQRDLLRMATQVTDAPAQIPLPLKLTGLPPKFRPASTFLWRPGDFGRSAPGTWSALLMFNSGDLVASVDVGPHGSLAETVPPIAAGTECATSAGLDVCVQSSDDSSEFDRLGGAKGLLKHVTLLGPDEKQWTTNVIAP